MRRMVFVLLSCAIACAALAQDPEHPSVMSRPDISFVIREHQTGADLVQITMQSPTYPEELLKLQIDQLGKLLNSVPRGLDVSTYQMGESKNMKFVKATFAIDGIIDRPQRIVRIEPILKAFVGAPEPHTLHQFLLSFEGELPSTNMYQQYKKEGVLTAEAKFSNESVARGVDYYVRLDTQDPQKIVFPEKFETTNQTRPSTASQDNRGLIIGLFAVAGIALGALVYLALLRAGKSARK